MVFLDKLDREVESPLRRIPELCIEVLSGNRAYDRITKRFLYAEAGVAEYWIVDPAGVIERRTGPGLVRREEIADRLTSALLPGFELDVGELFDSESRRGPQWLDASAASSAATHGAAPIRLRRICSTNILAVIFARPDAPRLPHHRLLGLQRPGSDHR